jgi:hypothetical protein
VKSAGGGGNQGRRVTSKARGEGAGPVKALRPPAWRR